MSYLSEISFRRGIGLLVTMLALLVGGSWTIIEVTIDRLLNNGAGATARDWAHYLVVNVKDLEQIAAGEQPSAASMVFLEATRHAGQVFRYVIFNRAGYSQLITDRDRIELVDLSEYSPAAARAIETGQAVVDVKRGSSPNLPDHFAEAYVPALVGDRPVAVVAAFLDQTEQRRNFFYGGLLASVSLCLLTALSFGVPAVAWYRRTKEKQEADRRIRFLAHHDALTGLTNRARSIERLESALAVLPSSGGAIAVHFIDIDHFKEVNDTLGHDAGDFLLKTLAERLQSVVRFDDVAARIGGDEFLAVQAGLSGKDQAEEFARRITAVLTAPMHFREQEIAMTVSIGIALAPEDGNTSERILKSADLALYKCKADGRNCIRFFTPELDEALQAHLRIEKIVREALLNDRFELHYQPVFEIDGRRLVGFEALLRLPAPDGTLLEPEAFFAVATEIRLIDKIGACLLRQACRTAATWPNHLSVAVNVSPAQFEAGNVGEVVAAALAESGLAPHRLELEITEALLLRNSPGTMAELRKLKSMGVAIVMDDFGTGYSSLSYLWQFPFDKIKIDRSFMQGFGASRHDAETVVKTIIALGRELHMPVTVEGAETANQVDFLYDLHADQVQGFYFGRAVPASEIGLELIADLQQKLGRPAARPAADAGFRAVS